MHKTADSSAADQGCTDKSDAYSSTDACADSELIGIQMHNQNSYKTEIKQPLGKGIAQNNFGIMKIYSNYFRYTLMTVR